MKSVHDRFKELAEQIRRETSEEVQAVHFRWDGNPWTGNIKDVTVNSSKNVDDPCEDSV